MASANVRPMRALAFRKLYLLPEWFSFRDELLELDHNRCRDCHREAGPGVVLQVHHKTYVTGRMPWDYSYEDCETLCRRCHAVKHKKIAPFNGWDYVDDEDLEELCGECEYCGNHIRYVYYIEHQHWFPLAVGENCCENLTTGELAPNGRESMTRFASRRQRFASSDRWQDCGGQLLISQRGIQVAVEPIESAFRLKFDDIAGKLRFQTPLDAKRHAFQILDSRVVQEFLSGRQNRPHSVSSDLGK